MLRKKRVIVTEQAAAAVAAGVPAAQALEEHGTPVPAAESTPEPASAPAAEGTSAEGTPAVEATAAEGSTAAEGTPAPAAEGTPAVEGEPAAEAVHGTVEVAADATTTALLDRLQETQTALATQAAALTTAEAALAQALATQVSLTGIAAAFINRMQVGMGSSVADLTHLSAENLVAQYQSTLTLFEERFPVGGKAEVPDDDGSHSGKVVPLVTPAVARATKLGKGD
jgi:hypothetical protein